MADTIRELRRRWRESGAVDDEARWLQARLRAGDIPRARLELAAFLDHPAAQAALGSAPHAWPREPEARLRAWGKRLSDHGVEACTRAALAEAHHKLGILLRPGFLTPGSEGRRAACVRLIVRRLEAIEDWILEAARLGAERGPAAEALDAFGHVLAPLAFPDGVNDVVAWAYDQVLDLTERVARWARLPGDRVAFGTWWSVDFPFGEVRATRRAIDAELIPWALGLDDPLRTRLERIGIGSPCGADWRAMAGDAQVRRCGQCELDVYDLSAMTREEAQALVRERTGRVCVRFHRRDDGTVLTRDCPQGLADALDPYRQPPADYLMGEVALPVDDDGLEVEVDLDPDGPELSEEPA